MELLGEGTLVKGTVLAVCISEDKGEKKHDIQQGYFARCQDYNVQCHGSAGYGY
jgi:hypothetical protein